jgi:hypothetical protein
MKVLREPGLIITRQGRAPSWPRWLAATPATTAIERGSLLITESDVQQRKYPPFW